MFILKKGHQLGVYVPLRALFLVRQSGCTDLNNNKFNQILCRLNHVSQFYISQCPRVQEADGTLMFSVVC